MSTKDKTTPVETPEVQEVPVLTDLQVALMAAGCKSIAFGTKHTDNDQAIVNLTDEAILTVLRYGKRLFNDKWNNTDGVTVEKFAEDFFAKLATGSFRSATRTGGKSQEDRAQIATVLGIAQAFAWGGKATMKASKEWLGKTDPMDRLRAQLQDVKRRKTGLVGHELTDEEFDKGLVAVGYQAKYDQQLKAIQAEDAAKSAPVALIDDLDF